MASTALGPSSGLPASDVSLSPAAASILTGRVSQDGLHLFYEDMFLLFLVYVDFTK